MALQDWVPPALVRAYVQARYGPLLKASSMPDLPSPAGQVIVQAYNLKDPIHTPRRFDKLAEEGYTGNGYVYRAVNIISTAIAGIPIRAYVRKGTNARGKEVESHPILDLLARPNEDLAGPAFMERYVAFLLIAGNSYVQALRPTTRKGPPVQLDVLRPDRMRVTPGADGRVQSFEYAIGNAKLDIAKPDVLHTKTFAPLDDWYGLSPIAVAAKAVDIKNAGGEWNLALLQNSARLPGFFVAARKLGDTQFERMRQQLAERYTGARMAGVPGLLEEGLDWKPSGMGPADMDWLNLSREAGREIAITLGVPSELLGDSANKTYSNYQEARASMYTETALPLFDRIMGDLNAWLPPMYDGQQVTLAYDRNDIEALQEDRVQLWQRIAKADFLTVNEKRDALDYDEYQPEPKNPGDAILVNSVFATLEDVVAGTAKAQTAETLADPANPAAPPPEPPRTSGETPTPPKTSAEAGGPKPSKDPLDDLDAAAPTSAPAKARLRPKDIRRRAS